MTNDADFQPIIARFRCIGAHWLSPEYFTICVIGNDNSRVFREPIPVPHNASIEDYKAAFKTIYMIARTHHELRNPESWAIVLNPSVAAILMPHFTPGEPLE